MSISFSWNGLPQYAARLIRAAIDELGEDCPVVGTRPEVPVEGMERALGKPVHWVDPSQRPTWRDLGLPAPAVFIQSGWGYPVFNALGADARKQGAKVICLMDNRWRGTFRQKVLGFLAFRLRYRRRFAAMLVAGKSGRKLARLFGFPEQRIGMGMYGADPAIFYRETPITERPREMLFVGQFIERKDVLGLCRAFLQFLEGHPGWTLRLCGNGVQRDQLPNHPAVIVENFVQPEELRSRYNRARFFILPSLEEAWGLVVHEAAMSGCGLLLSDAIGSAPDLATEKNALRFPAGDSDAMADAMARAASWDDARLQEAEAESLRIGRLFGPHRFAAEICKLVELIGSRANERKKTAG